MTSLAFIFGVLPLAISTGAGAKSRIAIGTAVIGGMLTATVLAIFYMPLFFVAASAAHASSAARATAPDHEPTPAARRQRRSGAGMSRRLAWPRAAARSAGRLRARAALRAARAAGAAELAGRRRLSAAERGGAAASATRHLPRPAAAGDHRPGAGQQSRPAHRLGQHRGRARAVPRPARRSCCPQIDASGRRRPTAQTRGHDEHDRRHRTAATRHDRRRHDRTSYNVGRRASARSRSTCSAGCAR